MVFFAFGLNCFSFTFQPDQAISAYTYERTLMMEQRSEILKEMRKASIKHPDKLLEVRFKLNSLSRVK